MANDSVAVFFSYSHRDETLKEELALHLKILEREGIISSWHDRKILPGDEWDHQIKRNLGTADIILLLISADFISSDYCWDVEVKQALSRHENKNDNAYVIPVILSPVDWTSAPFSKLQALPKNGQPVITWKPRSLALVDITKGVRSISREIIQRRQKAQAQNFTEPLGGAVDLEMVSIPAGSFLMGSAGVHNSYDEQPRHMVELTHFHMSKFLITQEQWTEVTRREKSLDTTPSAFQGTTFPVESINWYQANKFCELLAKQTGKPYRLPSEAEWEYACRAGTESDYSWGNSISVHQVNYGMHYEKTTVVDKFLPNDFGIHDMHGNVWEWCLDSWHDNYQSAPVDASAWVDENKKHRVLRGGSWDEIKQTLCRSANRGKLLPQAGNNGVGLRVVCNLSNS